MLSKRRALTAVEWAVDSPNLLLRELNRLYHTRAYRREYNPAGLDVMAADWDNLIVLDACRYDLFEERHGPSSDSGSDDGETGVATERDRKSE